MSQSRKDQLAETAIKSAILEQFGEAAIDEIEVHPGEGSDGNPMLFTTVFLKAEQRRMSGSQVLDATAAAATALHEIEDYRFPYVTFLEPTDQHAGDTRPAA